MSFSPVPLGLPPYFHFGAINKDVAVTKSVFGNLDYQVTQTINLHGGIRYTQSDQSIDGCSTSSDSSVNILQTAVSQEEAAAAGGVGGVGIPGQCVTLGPAPNFRPGNVHNTLDQNNVPWRVGIDWAAIKNGLLYFSVSKGYKAGTSPALGASNYDQLTPVTQEALLSYEVGLKQSLLDRSLQVNGALFHYDHTDKQELGRLQDPVYGAVQTLLSRLSGAHAFGDRRQRSPTPRQGRPLHLEKRPVRARQTSAGCPATVFSCHGGLLPDM